MNFYDNDKCLYNKKDTDMLSINVMQHGNTFCIVGLII